MTLSKQRIGYIDALRGLIMLLVVMTHVHRHSFGGAGFSFNSLISAELMPFFFFISGLLLGRRTENGTPGVKGLAKYTGKKILTLCVPAFVFIGIYAFLFRISYTDILWDAYKYGFWFTIVLAAFYLFRALLRLLFEKLCRIKKETAVWIYLCAGVLVFLGTSFIRSPFFPWKNVALNTFAAYVLSVAFAVNSNLINFINKDNSALLYTFFCFVGNLVVVYHSVQNFFGKNFVTQTTRLFVIQNTGNFYAFIKRCIKSLFSILGHTESFHILSSRTRLYRILP